MTETHTARKLQAHKRQHTDSMVAHCIHGVPLTSVLIAASVGGAVATLVSLLFRTRTH